MQTAKDLIDLGLTKEAADNIETILNGSSGGDGVDRARALQERARLRAAARDLPGAAADLRSALNTYKTYELPTDQFEVWVSLAGLMRQRKAAAAVHLPQSIRHWRWRRKSVCRVPTPNCARLCCNRCGPHLI